MIVRASICNGIEKWDMKTCHINARCGSHINGILIRVAPTHYTWMILAEYIYPIYRGVFGATLYYIMGY